MEGAEAEVREEAREAIREIARELARFVASTGIEAREFDHAFRAQLVASLAERLRSEGTEPTVARLAVMSGLPKSAVEQGLALRASTDESSRADFSERGLVLGLAALASLWTSDARFTAMYGVPRDLPLRRSNDSAESLEYLAELALPGVPFDRVVSALTDQGLVAIDAPRSTARLVSQTLFFRNLDAEVVSHYGRTVAGLMRNLRLNRERRREHADDKPWNRSLLTDRPIAEANIKEFVEIVSQSADRWFRTLETTELTYSRRHGEPGRRYAVCAFVSPDEESSVEGPVRTQIGDFSAPRLYVRSLVTSNRIGEREALEFRQHVAETGQAFLETVDAQHKPLLAVPGQGGARLMVCCFMFDVTGSAETAEQAIDLLDVNVNRRRTAKY